MRNGGGEQSEGVVRSIIFSHLSTNTDLRLTKGRIKDFTPITKEVICSGVASASQRSVILADFLSEENPAKKRLGRHLKEGFVTSAKIEESGDYAQPFREQVATFSVSNNSVLPSKREKRNLRLSASKNIFYNVLIGEHFSLNRSMQKEIEKLYELTKLKVENPTAE